MAALTALDTTEERILLGAEWCLRRFGLHRTSMADVAARASVSRGSVYRYFPDRQALIDAVLERAAERFVTASASSVDSQSTLAGQVGEAAVFILQHRDDETLVPGDEGLLATLLSAQIGGLLERWVEFWLPRLAAAEQRGEIRADLDHRQAAEWIVRLMLSFSVMPSVTVDLDDPDAVRAFVRDHLIPGLAPDLYAQGDTHGVRPVLRDPGRPALGRGERASGLPKHDRAGRRR